MHIGIESNTGFIYEGNAPYGHALWPPPIITHSKIVFASEGTLEAERSNDVLGCRFREDHYDPIARVRRGRFYAAEGGRSQPDVWNLQPHPALAHEMMLAQNHRKSLFTYGSCSIRHKYMQGRREQPLVLLGMDDGFTVWTIIHVERVSTGEEMVTLKARSGFGIVPEFDESKVPAAFRIRVRESLDRFADEVHRSAPVSVIDRARDAASQALIAYFELSGQEVEDLGPLAKKLEHAEIMIGASAAKIIARLHARAKPSERERRSLRAVKEQDADLAVQCVGAILCELGWAEWT